MFSVLKQMGLLKTAQQQFITPTVEAEHLYLFLSTLPVRPLFTARRQESSLFRRL